MGVIGVACSGGLWVRGEALGLRPAIPRPKAAGLRDARAARHGPLVGFRCQSVVFLLRNLEKLILLELLEENKKKMGKDSHSKVRDKNELRMNSKFAGNNDV